MTKPEHPLQAAPAWVIYHPLGFAVLALGKHSEDREARCRSLSSGCRWSEGPGRGPQVGLIVLGWGFLWVTYCSFLCFLTCTAPLSPPRRPILKGSLQRKSHWA